MNRSNEILHAYLQVSRHISEKFRIYYGKLNLTYPQSIVLAILDMSSRTSPISSAVRLASLVIFCRSVGDIHLYAQYPAVPTAASITASLTYLFIFSHPFFF